MADIEAHPAVIILTDRIVFIRHIVSVTDVSSYSDRFIFYIITASGNYDCRFDNKRKAEAKRLEYIEEICDYEDWCHKY